MFPDTKLLVASSISYKLVVYDKLKLMDAPVIFSWSPYSNDEADVSVDWMCDAGF